MSLRIATLMLVLWISGYATVAPGLPAEVDLAITNICLIDPGAEGDCVQRDILVVGDQIVATPTTGTLKYRALQTVDGTAKFALPGLWDMHVHALWDSSVYPVFFNWFIAHGVLGIRDMGGDLSVLREAKAKYENRQIRAPYFVSAGAFLDGPEPADPDLSLAIATPPDVSWAVSAIVSAGGDFLKIYTLLPETVADALFDEADEHALPVAGHWPAEWTLDQALRMASIEHIRAELSGYCAGADETECDRILDRFAASRVHHVPALTVRRNRIWLEDHAVTKRDALDALPPVVTEYWLTRVSDRDLPESDRLLRVEGYAEIEQLTQKLFERGLPVMAGTDAGLPFVVPGAALLDELELYQELGVAPSEILRSAITVPVEFLELESQFGRIETGMTASFILVDDNPRIDISNLRTLNAVILKGEYIDQFAVRDALSERPDHGQ